MQKQVIGLIGPAGAGKSTAAKALCRYLDAEIIPFATRLKLMISVLGIPGENLRGDLKEEPLDILGGKSARHAMQTLGTEWGRMCMDQDFWVRLWTQDAVTSLKDAVIADDVRFSTEIEAIRSIGGIVIRITRDDGSLRIVPDHPSEQWRGLPFDIEVRNNCDIRFLGIKLIDAIHKHRNNDRRLAS